MTAAFFSELGYEVAAVEIAATVPLPAPTEVLSADVLVLTSAAAVPYAVASTRHYQLLACVGEVTAQAARAAGLEPDVVGVAGGVDLSRRLALRTSAWPRPWRLVHLAGDHPTTAWHGAVASVGAVIELKPAYTTQYLTTLPPAVTTALQAGEVAAILLFSARSAQHFFHLAPPAAQLPKLPAVVALSAAVANACQAWVEAPTLALMPDRHGMAAALRRLGLVPPANNA